jgi:hypothetical protein
MRQMKGMSRSLVNFELSRCSWITVFTTARSQAAGASPWAAVSRSLPETFPVRAANGRSWVVSVSAGPTSSTPASVKGFG